MVGSKGVFEGSDDNDFHGVVAFSEFASDIALVRWRGNPAGAFAVDFDFRHAASPGGERNEVAPGWLGEDEIPAVGDTGRVERMTLGVPPAEGGFQSAAVNEAGGGPPMGSQLAGKTGDFHERNLFLAGVEELDLGEAHKSVVTGFAFGGEGDAFVVGEDLDFNKAQA